ncbi:hypothetical protein ACFQ1E_09760 [Sphingomonas canadensis]|uniref:Secreted protein n=1 Tax=Sphingomonas canadensis TaxID=1219257 RepID=A0ABW3H920_9SPHN|nr:hypothetical protein [Sphingomonas canadensis]MCW3836596.1 hypothetical protein [Sphingomonas canadensis]
MFVAALMLFAGVQEAPPAASVGRPDTAADGTQRWSILIPDPCEEARRRGEQIVVCGTVESSQRLPLPGERGPPDRPMPGNPNASGSGALAMTSAPCATRSEGCTTGINIFGGGTFLARALGKLVDGDSCCEEPGEATDPLLLARDAVGGVKRLFKKKPDKSKRIPILLDDPAPEPAKTPAP